MNKRTILGALAVFMFLLIAAQSVTAQQQPSARVMLREGNEYFGQGNYREAIELYESIIRLYPESSEANEAKKKLESPEIRSKKSSIKNYEENIKPYVKEQETSTTPEQSVPKEVLSTTTTENADGSTTTTTKYADGSTTTTTKKANGDTRTVTKKTLPPDWRRN